MFFGAVVSAQNSISGVVVDENKLPLIGVNVVINETSVGVITDFNGKFDLVHSQDLPWIIRVSHTGFKTQELKITTDVSTLEIVLIEDIAELEAVVISASRNAEKIIDAVASVSLINEKEINANPITGDVSELLRNTVGVNLVKNGAAESNIEIRGSAVVNESNTLVLKDFMPLTGVDNKRINSAANMLVPIDIARVEIVRGPTGALYGPNVTSGVVHYITKNPFNYPGIDASFAVGNQNQTQSAFRIAGHNKSKNIGYKFLFKHNQVDEFSLAQEDLVQANGMTPVIATNSTFTLNDGSTINVGDNLIDKTRSTGFEATLIYKFNNQTKLSYVGSWNSFVQNYRNQISHEYNGGMNLQHQLKFSAGDFFMTFYNRMRFGSKKHPGSVFSFNYTNGDQENIPTGNSQYYDIAAQYNIDFGNNTTAVIGTDLKSSPSEDNLGVFGVNSGQNEYSIYGGYLSLKHEFNDRFSANGVGRYDYYSAINQGAFSPRLGLLYKPTETSAIRFSMNRSYSSESKTRTWLDFTLPVPGFFPESHAIGVGQEIGYDNPVTQFAFGEVIGGDSFLLSDIITALALNAGVAVDVSNITGTISPELVAASFQGAQIGTPRGPISSLEDVGQKPPKLRTVNSLELGYTGLLGDKLKLNANVFYNVMQNIQPQGVVPISAGAQLNVTDITSEIMSLGLDASTEQMLIDALNQQPFNPTPNPNLQAPAGYGLVLSDNAQANGYLFDLGFPTYGKENVKYWGMDIGVDYFIDSNWSAFANYSYVSKNIWTPNDLGENNPNFDFYLNTPEHRINGGLKYLPKKGFYGTLTFNSQAEFDGKQGDGRIFTGTNDSRTIFDASIGYELKLKGLKSLGLGLNINNLFNKPYKQFVNLPVIKRLFLFSAKVHL